MAQKKVRAWALIGEGDLHFHEATQFDPKKFGHTLNYRGSGYKMVPCTVTFDPKAKPIYRKQ
jgi:hypothetical protein